MPYIFAFALFMMFAGITFPRASGEYQYWSRPPHAYAIYENRLFNQLVHVLVGHHGCSVRHLHVGQRKSTGELDFWPDL